MQQYYDLEMSIMSCLLLKPELMKDLKLEDKHFIKHQRLWQFMKAFYKKYENFDLMLMYNVCSDKYSIINYIEALVGSQAMPFLFEKYQDQLIEQYNQSEIDKWLIKQIYQMANDLYVGNISIEDFETRFFKSMEDRETYQKRQNKANTATFE